MGRVRRNKRRVAIAAVTILASLAALTMTSAGAAAPPTSDQTRLLLRFSDLVLGYMNFEFGEGEDRPIVCSQLTHPEDTPPKLKRFVLRFHPRGCLSAYYSRFTLPGHEPGPKLIGTGVMALESDRAADAAWRVVPMLLGRLLGDRPPHEVDTNIELGNATKLFHAALPGETRVLGRNTSFLVWRTGNTLAVIETFGAKIAKDDRDAALLAPLQQAHIENPTPYTGAERYDEEVPLDDPALKHPVYWLGRAFSPPEHPATHLEYAEPFRSQNGREKTGKEIRLDYEDAIGRHLTIDEWSPRQWRIFKRSRLSRTLVSWHCTKTRTVQLAEGTATIYAGYKHDYRKCPSGPPTSFTARASLPGVFIALESPFSPDVAYPTVAYDSYEQMEAFLTGLVLRPQRTG
jgi:hypothetical protein